MILIFSNSNEFGVNKVIDWLYLWNEPFMRINENTEVEILEFKLLNYGFTKLSYILKIGNCILNYSDIKSVWFRQTNQINFKLRYESSSENKEYFDSFFKNEFKSLFDFFVYSLEQKKCIGKFKYQDVNKIITLHQAKIAGFNIPNTYLFSCKNKNIFRIKDKNLITKSIQDICIIRDCKTNSVKVNYTVPVFNNDLVEPFALSLFQKNLENSIPIRIFYLNESIFACQIFSGTNEKATDSRLYKYKRFLRVELPTSIVDKILVLSKVLGINSGSIDLMLLNKTYYFLEINPVGQFGFISYQFNGLIEREIAKFLST